MEKNLVKGYILEYKYKDRKSLALLNQKLFGRLSRQRNNGKTYCYYIKGMLDNTKFYRLRKGRIFVTDDNCLDRTTIGIFSKRYKIYELELDLNPKLLKTGYEYWKEHSNKKGVTVNGWGNR